MPRFQKFYDAWRAENAAHIANGGKFIHEQAQVGGVDADAGMAKLADADVGAPAQDLARAARQALPADAGIDGAACRQLTAARPIGGRACEPS